MDIAEKVRENRLRRHAKRLGLVMKSSRAKAWKISDLGGYRLTDAYTGTIVAGERFDLDMDAVEARLAGIEREQRAMAARPLGADAPMPAIPCR